MYLLRDEVLSACDIASSDSVLIAFSGGADSVALLLEMKRFLDEGKIAALSAAHLNHGIRGEEADRDASFCRMMAERMGIPFFEGKADVPRISKEKRISLETAAREERYAFLDRVREESGCRFIATGHHRDDQVETVLMHLIRGCGTDGLAGMRRHSGRIVRPMLDVSKEDILSFLKEMGQSYCTDSTNLDSKHFRNRVRSQLIPLLEKWNPNIQGAIATMAEDAGKDSDYLSGLAEKQWKTAPDRYEIKALPDPIRMRVLKRYLPYDSFERADLETLDALLDARTGTQRNLKNGFTAWVSSNSLHVSVPQKEAYCYPIDIGSGLTLSCGTIELKSAGREEFYPDRNTAFLDADRVEGTLFVRNGREGDRFTPFGMTGSKLLSDYYTDRKVPRFERNAPLVCDEKGILYVAGYTIDERAKVTEQTKNMIQIIYKEGQ